MMADIKRCTDLYVNAEKWQKYVLFALDWMPRLRSLPSMLTPPLSPPSLALQPAHTHLAQQVDLPGLPLHRTLDALAPARLRISTQLISPARSGFKLAT